ncbi:MAG TPA: TetR/AcrR family transcriptional regulator [Anaerolineales bacterium]|nr:TetR/AcrR family transcriptional regulator [Anaerolineales bacterium]
MSNRQQEIMNATLDLVFEQGLLGIRISQIAQRAKASPGIIYHYFESKDEIIHSLYLSIFKELMDALIDDALLERPCLERLKTVWLRRFHFHISNPAKTKFIEQYKNSTYFTPAQEHLTNELLADLASMIQNDIMRGEIKALPLRVVHAMTMGVADNVAKLQIAGNLDLQENELNKIADIVSRSVLV